MERNIDVVVEVDDFKNAMAIARDLQANGKQNVDAVEIMTQWCATMREHYVKIGRDLAKNLD